MAGPSPNVPKKATAVEPKTWYGVLVEVLTARDVLLLLWTVGGGSYVAMKVGRMLPGWDVQDKVFAGLSAMAIGAFVFFVVAQIALAVSPAARRLIKQRLNGPPYLRVIPHNGRRQ